MSQFENFEIVFERLSLRWDHWIYPAMYDEPDFPDPSDTLYIPQTAAFLSDLQSMLPNAVLLNSNTGLSIVPVGYQIARLSRESPVEVLAVVSAAVGGAAAAVGYLLGVLRDWEADQRDALARAREREAHAEFYRNLTIHASKQLSSRTLTPDEVDALLLHPPRPDTPDKSRLGAISRLINALRRLQIPQAEPTD